MITKIKSTLIAVMLVFTLAFLVPGVCSPAAAAAKPDVTTNSADYSAGDDFATLNAVLDGAGDVDITSYGFYYSTTKADVVNHVSSALEEVGDASDGLSDGDEFSLDLENLATGDTYYFGAYAENNIGTSYGSVESFDTSVGNSTPEVNTDSATAILISSATLNGNIVSFGDDNEITEYGFYYGTSSSPSTKIKVGDSSDSINEGDDFSYVLTDLNSGTKYYFKAYARNSQGINYGSVQNFTLGSVTVSPSIFMLGSTNYSLRGSIQTMDVAPYAKDNRTYMPIRYVGYAMGLTDAQIQWSPSAPQTVILTNGTTTVTLNIGSRILYNNGTPVTMDVAPEVRNYRTCLPIAWVAQAFGYTATWDGASTVTIR